MYGAVDKFLVH